MCVMLLTIPFVVGPLLHILLRGAPDTCPVGLSNGNPVLSPSQVLALTFFFSLLHKRELWKDKGQEQQLWWALGLVTGNSSSPNPPPRASICSAR